MRKLHLPELEFEINPDLIGEGITQSEMQTWDNCPEKWYLGYNLMLSRRGQFSWATTYGSWMHNSLEEFYRTKGKRWSWAPTLDGITEKDLRFSSQRVLRDRELYTRLGQLQMEIYASFYKDDPKHWEIVGTEDIIDFEFEGIRLKGKLDVRAIQKAYKRLIIWDHKTTGRLDKDTALGWEFRLQFMFYMWLAMRDPKFKKERPRGFMVNAVKKPQLKWGDTEPVESYLQRVQIDMMQKPEKYFYRDPQLLKEGDMERFEATILRPKLERVKMLFNPKISDEVKTLIVRNKNTDTCRKYGQPCEFITACKNGLDIEKRAFYRREVKHRELVEEANE
jgi:hypothetical protein